ncbi:MAG: methyltransferase domain-containing protein [Desulfobacterales bacterium]|nr:methyltransferase domain-containing protein [Desulfobacterales bacterium]
MADHKNPRAADDGIRDAVQAFYDRHPYPPPVDDLEGYRRLWQDDGRRRADFHLHWPAKAYRTDVQVLVAGCGTSQAAKHALRQPASHVVGIDLSATSVRRSEALKRKYNLANLEVYHLPVERAGDLGIAGQVVLLHGCCPPLPARRRVCAPCGRCCNPTAPCI